MNQHKPVADLLDQTPPSSIADERGLVGSLLLDAERCNEVALIVRPEDFHDAACAALYRHIVATFDELGTLDVTLLQERLRAAGDWELIGEDGGLGEAAGCWSALASNAPHYARIVVKKAQLRRLIQAGLDIIRGAYDPAASPVDVLDAADKALNEAVNAGQGLGTVSASDALMETFDAIDAAEERGHGVPTGLYGIDAEQGGLFRGELIVLAARPGQGKTSLGLQTSLHNAMQGRQVLLCSLEMSPAELMARACCSWAEVDSSRYRTGQLTDIDRKELVEASASLANATLEIASPPGGLTVADIRRLAHQQKRKAGLELLIVDYLGRIKPADRRIPKHEQVGRIAGELKDLARELDIPVLALCQLNRGVEQGKGKGTTRPQLSNLRDSGSIEQDADAVWFIHHEKEAGRATLIVAKNRNGRIGDYPLTWHAPTTTFATATEGWGDDDFTTEGGDHDD